MQSLRDITLKNITEQLPSDLTNSVIRSLSPQALDRLRDMFIFRVFAAYTITSHRYGPICPTLYAYQFLGVYSTREKAADRVRSVKNSKTTIIEYTLDATKGRRLFRINIPHSTVDTGLFPIINIHYQVYEPLQWMYPGSTTAIRKTDEVILDQDN